MPDTMTPADSGASGARTGDRSAGSHATAAGRAGRRQCSGGGSWQGRYADLTHPPAERPTHRLEGHFYFC